MKINLRRTQKESGTINLSWREYLLMLKHSFLEKQGTYYSLYSADKRKSCSLSFAKLLFRSEHLISISIAGMCFVGVKILAVQLKHGQRSVRV